MSPRNGRPERRQARGDSDSSSLALGQPGSKLPRALGLRGYQIAIAEAGTALGGRVTRESLAEPFRAIGGKLNRRSIQFLAIDEAVKNTFPESDPPMVDQPLPPTATLRRPEEILIWCLSRMRLGIGAWGPR